MTSSEVAQTEKKALTPAPGDDSLASIIKRVNSGDKIALERLRSYLKQSRSAALQLGGDISYESTVRLVEQFAGPELAGREAILSFLNRLRMELCAEQKYPSGIERLLIEEVIATWLHVHRLEMVYAQQDRSSILADSYFQKELTAAHKRYVAALKALSDVRRRPLPNIQINVAQDQVNVAGNVMPAPPAAAPKLPPPSPPPPPPLAVLSPAPAPPG